MKTARQAPQTKHANLPAVLRACSPQRDMIPPGARRVPGIFRSPLQGSFRGGLTQGDAPCGRLPWAILAQLSHLGV
jgi:hypothetical protein